jgi:hypothetical protein
MGPQDATFRMTGVVPRADENVSATVRMTVIVGGFETNARAGAGKGEKFLGDFS